MSHVELRYNLATKVMRNGVEVIVATDRNLRPVEAEYLRHLSSTVTRPITLAPHTLTNLMSMVLPTDHSDDGRQHLISILQPSFTTRTYYTTYNYPVTISKDNMTAVSNVKTTVTNIRTEEQLEQKPTPGILPIATQSVTLSASPTLQTEVFPTAYTYWNTFLDGDQPVVMSATRTLSNTLVGAFGSSSELEPSEVFPSTNTYLKTVGFTRTITDGTDFQVINTKDLVTQVVVTDRLVRKATNVPVTTDVTKTYFVTYTYFSTYIDGDQTKVKSDVSVSSDVTIEKFYIKPKKTETKVIKRTSKPEAPTEFSSAAYPFDIFATKTYLTTFTYFTTLFQGSGSDKVGAKVNSRTKVVENTVTKTIPLRDFDTDYLLKLNNSLNRITGAFITTATLKGGEKVKITAHRNSALSSSYLQYEIKPTKTIQNEQTATEPSYREKNTQEILRVKPIFSKSSLLSSKTKSTQLQKSKIKPTKTLLGEATAEALVATEEETNFLSATPTITFTAALSSAPPKSDSPATQSSNISPASTLAPEEVTVSSGVVEGEIGQPPEDYETDSSKKKPVIKQPNASVNVTNLLNLNSLGINGMTVLGPVFNAMAELIHNNLNKNADSLSRRNDTAAAVREPEQPPRKPISNNLNPLLNFVNKFTPSGVKGTSEPKVKVTTPRAPVYIPVGSFAKDSEFGESQNSQVLDSRPENWHEKWTDTHAKNFDKPRPHDPPITILEGGIPISPGQVITTNSDVIIGRPGETAPRPPTFAIKNNIPVDMKPPPLPSSHAQFSQEDEDGFVAQHSINQGVDLSVSQEDLGVSPPRPLLIPAKKRPHQPHKNLRPHPNDRFRGSLQHKNPHTGKNTHSDYDSGTADLNPPPVPPPPMRPHDVHQPITINHDQTDDADSYKTPNQILPIPVHLGPNQNIRNYINPAEISPAVLTLPAFPGHVHQESAPPILSEPTPNINGVNPNGILLVPTVAQVPLNLFPTENPNEVDRSTGHQLLVKIQPSQVANIVIPHGSSTALILSDGKQHSLKGEVIDDPSPHPEPETVGFIGAEPVLKIENEDIAASFHNGVIPAETGEAAQQSAQDNQVVISNRPHLTTELIKIRPKPSLDSSKGRDPYASHSTPAQKPQHLFLGQQQPAQLSLAVARPPTSTNQDFSFVGNHRQTEHNHRNEAEIHVKGSPARFEDQNNLKGTKNVYSNSHLQTLHFLGGAKKEAQPNQNYRKEELNVNSAATNSFSLVKEVSNPGDSRPIQNQQKFHSYLVTTGGSYAEQNKFLKRPNPIRGGNGIYVDISPPGHLPPRPNANLLHYSHPPEKQQPTLKDHLLNHQSGLVHDVPLNAQVQLGSTQKKENPLKEILISANTNKHDHIHDSKKKPTETKFIQNHTQVKRPLPDLPDNLSPPPLTKENPYRIHRPLVPPHQGTAIQKYPLHSPVPKPPDFMIPPPQVLHRPVQNPRPEHPPRPIIPIGAGGPQQNYPSPRPEDILIVPHKNHHGSSPFNYVNNLSHDFKQTMNGPSDLDVSDSNDPVKTEYGEEIQESISRPLFPGQLPAELQKLNSSYFGDIHNDKAPEESVEKDEHTKSEDGPGATLIPGAIENPAGATSSHQQNKPESTASILSHRPFFSFIKKPSGFVTSNQGTQETSNLANHKESSNLENHKLPSLDPTGSPQGSQAPAKGGNIRIHAIGPAALPSGFVQNKNAVDHHRPATNTKGELVQQPSISIAISGDKNKLEESIRFPAANNQQSSANASSAGGKDKSGKPLSENKETKDKTVEAIKPPSGTTNYATISQNKHPGRHDSQQDHHKSDTSVSNQKFKTHSVAGQTQIKQEGQGGPIQFHSNKIPTVYPTPGVYKDPPKKPQRYPIADLTPIQTAKPSKRPSGFTTSAQDDSSGDAIPPSVDDIKKPPTKQAAPHSGPSIKIPAGFTYKNASDYSFPTASNHNYGNKTIFFYEPKPPFDGSEDRDVPHKKPDNNLDKWFSSSGGGDSSKKPASKLPSSHHNVSSLPNSVLPADPDVHITLRPPPRGGDARPKPEDVMGLSPPPLERPRRPQRPKPPFKFEIPTTPKPTLPPIAVENDFPPVRSPDFNKKPLKPQDIFPPRLPDNFVHNLPEYPIRNHLPQRPVTSMPIDTPAESSTEKSIYSDANSGRDTFSAGSEINGHSKPIADNEHGFRSKRPPLPSNSRGKPTSSLRPSTAYQQPPEVRITNRVKQQVSSKEKVVSADGISQTSTLSTAVQTTFHTKVSTSVTPTAEHPHKTWQPTDIITGSETVFDPDKFSNYVTPSIQDFPTKKNIVTTFVSTGSTTIFGDLYTSGPKQSPTDKKPVATKVNDRVTSDETIVAPTKTAVHTTTFTVTTTMTTVVHSIGHKPSTKTIVLTKTLLSTVFNKVTETKTLVRPTTATIIQTHTIATTKTALVVPTAFHPTQTKYPTKGTLKPEIFVADPHAKDSITISVSSSMNKNKHAQDKRPGENPADKDSVYVFMSNDHPEDDNAVDVISHEDGDANNSKVLVAGVFDASSERDSKEKNKAVECTPGCKAKKNELCQRIEGVMKCVCRPGFARMFPDRPCRPTYTYNVQLMLEKFGSEQITPEKNLVQAASPKMARLAAATKEGLDRMIMQSELRDVYHGVMVNGFQGKEKKTMVNFYVQLSENTDESKLMEILKKALQMSNYSLGGTELFADRESDSLYAEDFNECLSSKFHDCSENARCFNLKGTYTCSCKEGFTDLSENSQFPGRVCSDTIGCEYCGYHGACYSKGKDQVMCECFQWYSGERCHINLKVLLIALVTIGAVLLALLLVCALMACLNRSRGSTASRTNGSSGGYLRYRGPSNRSLDRRGIMADSSSESSVDNLPYVCAPPLASSEGLKAKKKPALRHTKGPAPRPGAPPGMDRSVTVMIPRAKYRPMPPLSPHLTMSTFSPDKHLSKTAAQIATEQKLINYLDGNAREDRPLVSAGQSGRQAKEQQKTSEYKTPSPTTDVSPKPEQKKDSKIFEYEYKISNMLFSEETNSADKRSFKSLDDRFRRHSDSTHLNSDTSNRHHFRKYSAGALVSAGYEVSAKVGMHHLEEDTTEDEHSAIINTHTLKSSRSQFTTLNRTGDHKTMSEARSYDETTVHPPTRSLKTHYSGSSPSSRVNNDEGHTMIERDLGSTFIMAESQLFKPEVDRGSDVSNFDSL